MAEKISYSELVNIVEENKLKTRYDVIAYFIGYYETFGKEDFELINKLYDDMFISE